MLLVSYRGWFPAGIARALLELGERPSLSQVNRLGDGLARLRRHSRL
jgi:hypothetical protein